MSRHPLRVCVYCASNDGVRPAYLDAARRMGQLLASRGATIVYGGGNIGLMGALADAALAAGGEVIGVMPHGLVQREVAHHQLTKLHIVDSMHQRKALMAELADSFVVLPGGLGTLEEFFETWTWAQLGVHQKPLGLLNVEGYWSPMVAMLAHVGAEGFLRGSPEEWLVIEEEADRLLDRMAEFTPPRTRRWLRPGET
ncbi:MAG: TIGR00730 family Rossman fold protein [Gemmatimonadaceae bacterium]